MRVSSFLLSSIGGIVKALGLKDSWQRVRDSNPCTGLERALIHIISVLCKDTYQLRSFLLLRLLLKAFCKKRGRFRTNKRRTSLVTPFPKRRRSIRILNEAQVCTAHDGSFVVSLNSCS
jgi:hypothetical protein